jgi:hypothetical protein
VQCRVASRNCLDWTVGITLKGPGCENGNHGLTGISMRPLSHQSHGSRSCTRPCPPCFRRPLSLCRNAGEGSVSYVGVCAQGASHARCGTHVASRPRVSISFISTVCLSVHHCVRLPVSSSTALLLTAPSSPAPSHDVRPICIVV